MKVSRFEFYCEHCGVGDRFFTLPINNVFKCKYCNKESDMGRSDSGKRIRDKRIIQGVVFRPNQTPLLPAITPPIAPILSSFMQDHRYHCCECGSSSNSCMVVKIITRLPEIKNGFTHKYTKTDHCEKCNADMGSCHTLIMEEDLIYYKDATFVD